MNECHAIDHLITAYVDDEVDGSERALVTAHLESCLVCRREVEAESTARRLLRAHAALARTAGTAPSWRPHAFRLGRPALPVPGASIAALALAALTLTGVLIWKPRTVEAIGVIGDSVCAATHQHSRDDAESRDCVQNCVTHGAEYVLVSGSTIYRIENQGFPDLAAFANLRVAVSGTMGADTIKLSRMNAAPQESGIRN